jgi:hypothetical protein
VILHIERPTRQSREWISGSWRIRGFGFKRPPLGAAGFPPRPILSVPQGTTGLPLAGSQPFPPRRLADAPPPGAAAAKADRPSSSRPASCRPSVITSRPPAALAPSGWRYRPSLECDHSRQDPVAYQEDGSGNASGCMITNVLLVEK